MKRRGKSLIVLFALTLSWSPAAAAQDGREVLDRVLLALGGEAKLEALHSFHATGSFTVSGLSGTIEWWAQSPDKLRQRFDLNVITIERAYDGSEGWRMRGDALAPVVGTDLAGLKRLALFHPLLTYMESIYQLREPV